MKKQLLFITLVLPTILFSQTTIWEENFDSYSELTGLKGPNNFTESNGYTTSSVTKWMLNPESLILTSATSDYLYVNVSSGDGELYARDIDGAGRFITEDINISSQTGNVTLKIGKIDFEPFSSGDFNGSEYVDIYYSLDNGSSYTLIPYQSGSENSAGHTFADNGDAGVDFSTSLNYSFDPGSATKVKVKIVMFNNGANERFEIDDISIERNSTEIWSENFDSYSENYGYVGGTYTPANENSGDYPASVTKWSLIASSGFLNQLDYAAVKSGKLEFNDVDNAVTFETENINITGVPDLTFKMDISFGSSYEGDEYLDIYFSTDGGTTYTKEGTGSHTYQAGVNLTDNSTINFSKTFSGLSSLNFKIKVVVFSDSNVEDFILDNLKVTNPSTASLYESFASRVKVFPNPILNNKTLNILTPQNTYREVHLFNIIGEKVFFNYGINNKLDLKSIKPGVYILKIKENNNIAIKKIIIK